MKRAHETVPPMVSAPADDLSTPAQQLGLEKMCVHTSYALHDTCHATREPSMSGAENTTPDDLEGDLNVKAQRLGLKPVSAFIKDESISMGALRSRRCRDKAAEQGITQISLNLPRVHRPLFKEIAKRICLGEPPGQVMTEMAVRLTPPPPISMVAPLPVPEQGHLTSPSVGTQPKKGMAHLLSGLSARCRKVWVTLHTCLNKIRASVTEVRGLK